MILESYQRMFGEVPRKARTPLIPSDHPDLGTTEFHSQEEIKYFQILIGQLQELITLEDLTLQPRKGHLERAKSIFGNLSSQPEGAVSLELESQTILSCQTKTMIG